MDPVPGNVQAARSKVMTVAEVRLALGGISRSQVYRLINRGLLRTTAIRYGKETMIIADDVFALNNPAAPKAPFEMPPKPPRKGTIQVNRAFDLNAERAKLATAKAKRR